MVYLHGLGRVAYAEGNFEFGVEDVGKVGAGEYEEVVGPVVDVGDVHGARPGGHQEARTEIAVGDNGVVVEEFHAGAGVAGPVCLCV